MSFLFGLYTCIAHEHDLALVFLAALICCLGAGSGFALNREALRSGDPAARLGWGAAAVIATTSCIWATHFIAMLAFEPGLPFRFNVALTVLSFAVALLLVGGGVGLTIVARGPAAWKTRIGGGVGIGLAISAMHYTGMSAYQVQGHLRWDAATVALSVLSGVALSAAAIAASFGKGRSFPWTGLALFVLAICLDHFLGMSAVRIDIDPRIPLPGDGLDKTWLVMIVTNVAMVIIALSLTGVWLAIRDNRERAAEDVRLRNVADIAVEGLLICSGETIVSANRSLERTLNCRSEDVVGRALGDFLPGLTTADVPVSGERDAELERAAAGRIPVRVIGQRIEIRRKPHTVVAVRDQRERLLSEAKMMQLAHEDPLTGLANRLSFGKTLADRFQSHRDGTDCFAFLMLDLDRFKTVNDTLGHGMGDALLRRVAGRLERAVRDGDVVARLGGDEFAVLADAGSGPDAVRAIAEDIVDLISRPFLIDGHVLEIATSIGIALVPGDGTEPSDISRNADLALYRAKQEGGGTYRFFKAEMNARAQRRRSLELDLRRASSREEFEVYYQPQVDARTGAFEGAEALVRWNHSEHGMVSPADFIPMAEEIGLIGAIGEWVLRAACAEAAGWPGTLSVAVNLSPVQLRDQMLASTVAAILAQTGLPAARLELEVTEGALLHDDDTTYANLHALRRLGIRISMDDFGTGYCSLSYLRRFPFDKLKIDQSFIRQVPGDADSVAIVQAVASLGAKLGMKVTAEGVETVEQEAFAMSEGCDQIQGYLIGRPMPAAGLREIFADAACARAVA